AGQLQVVEEKVHELILRQGKGELVAIAAAIPRTAALALAAAAGPALGPGQAVVAGEFPVARQDDVAVTTGANGELGLGNIPHRNPHLRTALHIGDGAPGHGVGNRPAQLALVAADKALAITGAFVAVVEAAVDDHWVLRLARSLKWLHTECGLVGRLTSDAFWQCLEIQLIHQTSMRA